MASEATQFIRQYFWVIIVVVVGIIALSILAVWAINQCRKKARYEYCALEEEALLQDRMELDKKHKRDVARNMAMAHCQHYLRRSTRYTITKQVDDLGSRLNRSWFLVRDLATKTERMLNITPVPSSCIFKCNNSTQRVLMELFLTLQHPYVYPVLDFEFKMLSEKQYAIVVTPYSDKGSLKDLIYHSNCLDQWYAKYHYHRDGLPLAQIQRLGRQILEGLLFLEERGFPPFSHLHSGNVIIQNGVARICGLENPLLGYVSRMNSIIQKNIRDNKDAVHSICFGHLLFEMAAGFELSSAHLTEKHYSEVSHMPQVITVLKFIFEQNLRYPSPSEISCLDFFRHIDLRELCSHSIMPVFQAKLSPAAQTLLEDLRRHARQKKQNKRSQSTSAIETASICSKESEESRGTKEKKRTMSISQTTSGLVELCSDRKHPSPSSKISCQTVGSLSNTSGSTEYYTPPDTPLPSRLFASTVHSVPDVKQSCKFRKFIDSNTLFPDI